MHPGAQKEDTHMTGTDKDRDVVVVERGGNTGTVLLAVVLLALLVVAVWFFALGPGQEFLAGAGSSDGGVNVNIELPPIGPEAS
jgi:hypothetical protein